jgi:hypothetical protein
MQMPEPIPQNSAPPIPHPSQQYHNPAATPEGDATGGMIPYKNGSALLAYYIGLFSALPILGLPMGIAAIILGCKGLRYAKEKPAVKGVAHAWIGIVCGAFWTLFYGLLMGGLLLAMLSSKR